MQKCVSCGRAFQSVLATKGNPRCRTCEFERKGEFDLALAEQAWANGYALGYRRGLTDSNYESDPVPLKLVEDAISLCHPDRHPPERERKANAVTTALIRARDQLRKLAA